MNIKPVEKNAHWYERTAEFNREKNTIKNNSVIFLGNSITEWYDFEKFFPDKQIINRGISSDHIDGVIDRLDICPISVKNAKLFILIGINDIASGRSEEEIKYLYKKLINLIIDKKIYDIYLQSIMPVSSNLIERPADAIININAYIKELVFKKKLHFLDIYPLFTKENSKYANEKYFKDGLHLNEKGYQIWTKYLNTIFSDIRIF